VPVEICDNDIDDTGNGFIDTDWTSIDYNDDGSIDNTDTAVVMN
jgi:hypothetical protein